MVEDLATIISLINNATDLDKKMVTSAQQLSQAASMLESFPMTRAQLETTRLGKLLNEVRRFTDSTDLQRRLRRLLKGWQPLVSANDPNYSVVVNGNGSNPVPAPPAQVAAVQPAVDEATVPVANAASVDGESGSVGSVGSSASVIVPPPAATPSSASVRIRKRAAANAASGDTASSASAVPAKLAKCLERRTAWHLSSRPPGSSSSSRLQAAPLENAAELTVPPLPPPLENAAELTVPPLPPPPQRLPSPAPRPPRCPRTANRLCCTNS
uniref:TFIIS N-terminal domain-containing protein n=1 Tax=Macrostomum lignano TaxID=282301 RepID=A0A1I8I0M9_9PLAT